MFQNGRTTIAVLLGDINADYQAQVSHTIGAYAKKLGYNVAFFSCFSTYGNENNNAKGEYNIINLPPYERFDAFIICADTFYNKLIEPLLSYLDTRSRGPVVCMRRQFGDYPSVLIDESKAITQIVEHFYKVHNFTRIAFMSGPNDNPDSINRLTSYKKALRNLGLSYDESLVFEGDFWKAKAKEAADYFTRTLDTPPQAIVCANDYMAISLASELIMNDYMVPDDIAISGFDDISDAKISVPPLTTISVSPESLVQATFQMITDLLNDADIPTIQYIPTQLTIRNSCGCETYNNKSMAHTRVTQFLEYNNLFEQIVYQSFTSIDLEQLKDCSRLGDYLHISENYPFVSQIQNFHLCLGEAKKGCTYPCYYSSKQSYPKRSYAVCNYLNQKQLKKTAPFDTIDLLPPEVRSKEPMIYFFLPIHYQEFTFGYLAISYTEDAIHELTFPNWISTISNAMENLRISNKNAQLIDDLNTLYIHDSLTKLYNRRGFQQMSEKLFATATKKNQTICILGIDMDNLKTINDAYGHQHGDIALTTLSNALTYAATNNEVCARMGGDEFNIIGIDYDEEKANGFVSRFQQYLDDFNKNSAYNYVVEASYGISFSSENELLSLEELILLSDSRLYEQKRKKKGQSN